MQDVMDVLKALSDENRVRILCALDEGELCVCQLIELLKLAPSTVSKHLSIMKTARLVESRKEGRWIYYRLATKGRMPETRKLVRIVLSSIGGTWQIREDRKKLAVIKKMDTDKLCASLMKR